MYNWLRNRPGRLSIWYMPGEAFELTTRNVAQLRAGVAMRIAHRRLGLGECRVGAVAPTSVVFSASAAVTTSHGQGAHSQL